MFHKDLDIFYNKLKYVADDSENIYPKNYVFLQMNKQGFHKTS